VTYLFSRVQDDFKRVVSKHLDSPEDRILSQGHPLEDFCLSRCVRFCLRCQATLSLLYLSGILLDAGEEIAARLESTLMGLNVH